MKSQQEQIVQFQTEMERMNQQINSYGKIAKSSSLITHWHTLNNVDWLTLLTSAQGLEAEGSLRLKSWCLRDIDRLIKHIEHNYTHCDNLLYPTVKETNSLPHKITHFDRTTSVKTVTFKTMMNLREAYCAMLGIDLPNEDSSKGLLNPTRFEVLFDVQDQVS